LLLGGALLKIHHLGILLVTVYTLQVHLLSESLLGVLRAGASFADGGFEGEILVIAGRRVCKAMLAVMKSGSDYR
jgi:chemotaxis protein CheY-P-specific phosphatase CheC